MTRRPTKKQRLATLEKAVVKSAVYWFNSDRKQINHEEAHVRLIDRIIDLENFRASLTPREQKP